MKIAIIGYGKMGQAIEKIALQRGHEISLKITSTNRVDLNAANLESIDVAIEFTSPEAAKENVLACLKAGVPVVCGTTGWYKELPEAEQAALDNNTAFLPASNFSVGVNIFFEVNKALASLMNGHLNYDVTIEETHHTQKKDAPSGTAITLAEQLLERLNRKEKWILGNSVDHSSLSITAHREEGVPGTHQVRYSSEIDDIEIIHTAHNRDGFALGAVMASESIAGKVGLYTMKDVLGL